MWVSEPFMTWPKRKKKKKRSMQLCFPNFLGHFFCCNLATDSDIAVLLFTEIETGFDVEDTSVDGRDDIEGLDASAAHVANLLSSEPSDGTFSELYHNYRTKGKKM